MVKVYSKNNCIQCKQTKQWLKSRNIQFEEINIEENPDERSRLLSDPRGFKSMPIVFANDKAWSGFRPDELASI